MEESIRAVLPGCFLFAGVPEGEAMAALAGCGSIRRCERGEVVLSPQRFTPMLGVVLQGRLEARNDHVLLMVLGPGRCFGVAGLWSGAEEYVSTVRAQKESLLYTFSRADLTALFSRCPQTLQNYLAFLSDRIVFLNQKVALYSCQSVEGKVYAYFKQQAAAGCPQKINSSELGRLLGVGRASLYRAFEALQARGLIRKEGKTVTVLHAEEVL